MALEKWTVRMDADTAAMVRAVTHQHGLSLNDYILRAITNQLQLDVTNWPTGHLLHIVEQGTQKTTTAANFAAIHSYALLILLREWRIVDIQRAEGLPEDLARQTVLRDLERAVDESLAVFEDPRIRQQYTWVTRPERAEDLPSWLVDDDRLDEDDPAEAGTFFPEGQERR